MTRLTRRSFLALLGLAGAGGGAAAARFLLDDDGAPRWSGAAGTSAALFDDPEAARRLGEAYIRVHGGEHDRRRLVRLLSRSEREWRRALEDQDPAALRVLAGRRAARELAAGDLVEVDGWWIAPTEARLCALLAAKDAA
jgi:hypothetical protein